MKKYPQFFAFLLCSVLFISCTAQNGNVLSANDFEKKITTDSIQLLDVRTPSEFNSGHIANALQADWNNDKEFDRRIGFIDKTKPVYVYCLAGGRSAAAAEKMRKQGFKKIYELKGGINAWKAANKSLIGKSTEKQMTVEAYNNTIAGSKIVLVDFSASWCPPCKQMEPILQKVEKDLAEKFTLLKVDGGKDEDLVKLHNVTALPVFIIYKDGKEVWRKDGVCGEEELKSKLK
jgi:rhodanese-related sulfurtransferase